MNLTGREQKQQIPQSCLLKRNVKAVSEGLVPGSDPAACRTLWVSVHLSWFWRSFGPDPVEAPRLDPVTVFPP